MAVVLVALVSSAWGQWEIDHWPSDGSPGTLAAPWKPTNPGSTDPLKTGIVDAPVNAFSAVVLPDGRAGVVLEWIRPDAAGKPQIYLHVRAMGAKGWEDAAPPLLLGGSNAVKRNWKDVKFWSGGVILEQLKARRLADGTLRVAGVELLGVKQGNARNMRLWDLQDGKWLPEQKWTLTMPGDPAQDFGRHIEITADGEVYLSELRTCWQKPGPDVPADHEAIMGSKTHPHAGELRIEAVVVRKYDPKTRKTLVMDYEAPPSPFHGVASFNSGMFQHKSGLPMVATLGLPVGVKVERKQVTSVMQWRDGGWKALDVPGDLGLPAGQRPDGMPVWTVRPQRLSTDGSFRPETIKLTPAEFVELDAAGKPKRGALPAECVDSPTVEYVDSIPILAAVGPVRQGKMQGILAGVATRGANGRWAWLGSPGAAPPPPYWRPFHGGHDSLRRVDYAIGSDRILLLWQGPMPIHGPLTVSGAFLPVTGVNGR